MITLYTKDSCPYCVNAKNWLDTHGFEFCEIDVSQDNEAYRFITESGHRTVPQIYFHGKLLVEGGWQGLSTVSPEQLREDIEIRETMSSGTL